MLFSHEHHEMLDEILRWRRDVRHFRTDPINQDVLAKLEACIDLAPSVGNSRPWRVVRVNSADVRQQIINCFEQSNREAGSVYEGEARNDYFKLKLAGLIEAPTQLAFFTDMNPAEGRGLGRQTMPETLSYSTVMAIHTLWLTARSLNVGVGWVSILEPRVVCDVLAVPETWRFIAYLCVGYPSDHDDRPELDRRGWQINTPSKWIDR